MPPRLERRQQTGNLHFITFSCHNRNPYLASPAPRPSSSTPSSPCVKIQVPSPRLRRHARTRPPPSVRASNPSPLYRSWLPQTLRLQKTSRNSILASALPRLQRLFTAKHIEKLRYLHRNPVARGLVATPAEYPWSSFQTYATRIQSTVKNRHRYGCPMIPAGYRGVSH
jgi:putative transposase